MTAPVDDYEPQYIWTVKTRVNPGDEWATWTAWVDYSTAVTEQIEAERDGCEARIVRAT